MLKGKMVRVRMKRYFAEQKLWVFVGMVSAMTENWLFVDGKGVLVCHGHTSSSASRVRMDIKGTMAGQVPAIEVDLTRRLLALPQGNIASVRILPDSFDLDHLEICTEGFKIGLRVKGAEPTWIGEIGES